MAASLCIQVYSGTKATDNEIRFYEADEWTIDTEKELLIRIQEILAVIRNIGHGFEVIINLEVKDINSAIFLLKKKKNNEFKINNQKLSIREIEILGLIMQGLTNNEIAEKLLISHETVKSHRKHILEKTGAKNTAVLINYYHQTFFEK